MAKSALLVICSIFTMSVFNSLHTSQSDQSHRQWLHERYLEAVSIKEGMTRTDLLKIFEPDGGIQALLPERYVLKGSGMIKVDVKFDVPQDYETVIVPEDLRRSAEGFSAEGRPVKVVPNEKLRIKSISKPYLEPFALD